MSSTGKDDELLVEEKKVASVNVIKHVKVL